jgi:hypothetical protein
LNLVGLDNHESLVRHAGLVLSHRASRIAPGKARGYPRGLGLFPLGLGFLAVVERGIVIDQSCHGVRVGRRGAEQGQLGLRCLDQGRAGSLALRAD